jgi:hypothetical protein
MPAKMYRVTLSEEERQSLKELVRHGKCAARKLTHAHILLLADENRTEGAWQDDKITDQRTKIDLAHCMRDLVDIHFPDADKIVLVMDNLNTHKLASLYDAFPAPQARRIIEKLEIHYTPKHGSWLNMAEIELSVLGRQCLNRRIPNQSTLRYEVAAWQDQRNAAHSTVQWRFTTADARIKLQRLYPITELWRTTSIKLARKVREPEARLIVTTLSSSGWRRVSRFLLPNSDNL